MSEHPVVACYRGPDSAHAVQLGVLLAEALDEPLALACAYRYELVGLSARAQRPDNSRRAGAAQATLRAARTIAGTSVEVREHTVPFTGSAVCPESRYCDSTPLGDRAEGKSVRWRSLVLI